MKAEFPALFAFVPGEDSTGHDWQIQPCSHVSDSAMAGAIFAAGLREQ